MWHVTGCLACFMKLIKVFFIFASLVVSTSYSRAQEQVILKVFYKFSHVRDTLYPNYAYKENMVLLVGKNSSEFKSYDRMIHDSVFMASRNINSLGLTKSGSGGEIFLFPSTERAMQAEVLVDKYIFPIDYPKIDWKIANDTLSINGLNCQKAIGNWKGRTYEVWFCADLPFHVGPWKLCGLPGLILKARDLKNQVIFEFAGLQNYRGTLKIEPPGTAIKTSRVNYTKLHDAFLENPISFIKSTMPQISNIKVSSPYVRKPPINNPLELEK